MAAIFTFLPSLIESLANRGRPSMTIALVYLGNLIHAIATCFTHPVVIRKTYLVSDGEDGSVPKPTRRIVIPLERPARLLSLPPA
jgi:hypothetical protein